MRLTCVPIMFWLLLYAHTHRSILGAAGHVILTQDEDEDEVDGNGGSKYGHCPIRVSNQGPSEFNPTRLPTELTGPNLQIFVANG
jgi:hypothetical protein